MSFLRGGAPLPSEGAGAKITEVGLPQTCWPGRGAAPQKKTRNERFTTQHAEGGSKGFGWTGGAGGRGPRVCTHGGCKRLAMGALTCLAPHTAQGQPSAGHGYWDGGPAGGTCDAGIDTASLLSVVQHLPRRTPRAPLGWQHLQPLAPWVWACKDL